MAATETAGEVAPGPAPAAALPLLEGWGLSAGGPFQGWTAEAIEQARFGNGLVVTFARGEERVSISLRRASDHPKFTRVGSIDVSHHPVDPAHGPAAGQLTKAVADWLRRHGDGAALVPHLVDAAPPSGAPASAAEPARGAALDHEATRVGSSSYATNVVVEAPPLDPARRTPVDRPFFQFAAVDYADTGAYSDVLRRMYRQEFGCIVIRGVYPPDEMARVAALIEAGGARNLPAMEVDPRDDAPVIGDLPDRARMVGRGLESSPQLDTYLTVAHQFRTEMDGLFARAGVPTYEARIGEALAKIGGGRRVRCPQHSDGRRYAPATLRILPTGGRIPPHCGNHMINRPSYAPLRALVDPTDQLSIFLTVQKAAGAESEGSLIVYSVLFSGQEASERTDEAGRLDLAEWEPFKPGPGDLLIFDGGRYTHQVTPVVGARARLTIGGFLMFDPPGETIYYWG